MYTPSALRTTASAPPLLLDSRPPAYLRAATVGSQVATFDFVVE